MRIELLENQTVKVVLTNADMLGFNITYDDMDYKNLETRRVIFKLIDEIKRETSIDLTMFKLLIEAFPYVDGGCILYVNMLEPDPKRAVRNTQKTGFSTPLIYCFDDFNALCLLSQKMLQGYNHIILKSSLHEAHGLYYLMLYTYCKMESQLSYLLGEFGRYIGKGALAAAFYHEHATKLIDNQAIEVLSSCR